jgi:hypothetical protein
VKKIILHFNNWATTGGVPSFIRDFALTFPEFQHYVCSFNNYEEYDLIQWWRDAGIRYFNSPKMTRDIIEAIDPAVVILHNTTPANMESKWAWDVLYDRRSIAIHHNPTPILGTLVDWFVSDYVRSSYSDTKLCRKELIIPPCVYSPPFLKITRPKRDKVIGRIQSRTRGASPKELDEVLEGFNVYKPPIQAGKMAEYLRNIDVLAIWQSGTESWSRVTTEALMSGIPVVAYNRNDGLTQQMVLTKQSLVNNKEEFINALKNPPDVVYGKDWVLENASEKRLRKELTGLLLEWL